MSAALQQHASTYGLRAGNRCLDPALVPRALLSLTPPQPVTLDFLYTWGTGTVASACHWRRRRRRCPGTTGVCGSGAHAGRRYRSAAGRGVEAPPRQTRDAPVSPPRYPRRHHRPSLLPSRGPASPGTPLVSAGRHTRRTPPRLPLPRATPARRYGSRSVPSGRAPAHCNASPQFTSCALMTYARGLDSRPSTRHARERPVRPTAAGGALLNPSGRNDCNDTRRFS